MGAIARWNEKRTRQDGKMSSLTTLYPGLSARATLGEFAMSLQHRLKRLVTDA